EHRKLDLVLVPSRELAGGVNQIRLLCSRFVHRSGVRSAAFRRKLVNLQRRSVPHTNFRLKAVLRTSLPIHVDCAANFDHRLLRLSSRATRAFFDYLDDLIRIIAKLTASFGDRAISLYDRIRERAFAIDATYASVPTIIVKAVGFAHSQEEAMHLTSVAVFR